MTAAFVSPPEHEMMEWLKQNLERNRQKMKTARENREPLNAVAARVELNRRHADFQLL